MNVQAHLAGLFNRLLPELLSIKPQWVKLENGICIRVDSKHTLDALVELFITQPYSTALSLAERLDVVVDVGANRGLFALLVCYFARKRGHPDPHILCVEAATENFHCLQRHIHVNSLEKSVESVQGAVTGQRSGVVQFYYSPRLHGMGSITKYRRLTTQTVPVVDLAKFLMDVPRIDLMKIDIEGSEQAVIEEYPEVFAKVQVLVVEFHLKQVNYNRCKEKLAGSGLLLSHRTFEFKDRLCVDVFVRSENQA